MMKVSPPGPNVITPTPAAIEEDCVSLVAQEALRHLSAGCAVSIVAYTTWLMPWTCVISIPAMLVAGAYYESFSFNVVDSVIGTETLEHLAQKTQYVAEVLFGTLFSLGSLELGVGIFFILYGSALATSLSSLTSFAIGALLISFSLQTLLPSGYANLFLCNYWVQNPHSVLIELNSYLREVRERRKKGNFHPLDPLEVGLRIADLFVPNPKANLDDTGIITKIRHDPTALSFLLPLLPPEKLDSVIVPYFRGPITEDCLAEIAADFEGWSKLNIESSDEQTVDAALLQIGTHTNALRGFLTKLKRLKKIEDQRLQSLLQEMEKQEERVRSLDASLQNDATNSLRQRLIARSEALESSEEHSDACFQLGTIMKDRESTELAAYLGTTDAKSTYTELARRGVRTTKDIEYRGIWEGVKTWDDLKSNLIEYLDP